VRGGRAQFRHRCSGRDHQVSGQSGTRRVGCSSARRVPARGTDDPGAPLFPSPRNPYRSAPVLERTGRVQMLALEPDVLQPDLPTCLRGEDQRGASLAQAEFEPMLAGSKGIERLILPHIGDAPLEQAVRVHILVVKDDLERGATAPAVVRHGVALAGIAAGATYQPAFTPCLRCVPVLHVPSRYLTRPLPLPCRRASPP
jgi:hypothetical protein